jgi:hypothetical protein
MTWIASEGSEVVDEGGWKRTTLGLIVGVDGREGTGGVRRACRCRRSLHAVNILHITQMRAAGVPAAKQHAAP